MTDTLPARKENLGPAFRLMYAANANIKRIVNLGKNI